MKRTRLFLLIFCIASLKLFAQDNKSATSSELKNLLNERKEKFDAYTSSLEKRSGIFGGKTKNDIQRSNEVLKDIVRTDNKIITTLNRVSDFRTFEKVNMNYDLIKYNEQLENLRHAVDTLNKQLNVLTTQNVSLKNKASGFQWLTYGLLSAITVLIILLFRKKIIPEFR